LGEIGRISMATVRSAYCAWLHEHIMRWFPGATVRVFSRHRMSSEVCIDTGDRTDHDADTIAADLQAYLEEVELDDDFYQRMGPEVPSLEEMQAAPWRWDLPQDILRVILDGDDPWDGTQETETAIR